MDYIWPLEGITFISFDFYHIIIHTENVFNAFAMAAFFKFITFSVFEMRYLLLVNIADHSVNTHFYSCYGILIFLLLSPPLDSPR